MPNRKSILGFFNYLAVYSNITFMPALGDFSLSPNKFVTNDVRRYLHFFFFSFVFAAFFAGFSSVFLIPSLFSFSIVSIWAIVLRSSLILVGFSTAPPALTMV